MSQTDKVQKERPGTPVSETYKPPASTEYIVTDNDSWVKIAQRLKMDAWDLIDFNFPGMKSIWKIDSQLASRQVNWYLLEYVGCEKSTDRDNCAFSSGLTQGRGVHKGGKIFLPKSAPPPVATSTCREIEIKDDSKFPVLAVVLNQVGGRMPTKARCLAMAELSIAKPIYQDSLAYDDIYVSDALGAGGNPFTIALPLNDRWIVILNLGPAAFNDPNNSRKSVLIHELAHAWQSQHHPSPWQFMVNCTESNAAAAVATKADAVSSNRWVNRLTGIPAIGTGEASAYAYIPGLPFGDYAGEQIAEQIEDFFYRPGELKPQIRGLVSTIWAHIVSVPTRKIDPANFQSLSKIRFEFKNTTGVIWSDGY